MVDDLVVATYRGRSGSGDGTEGIGGLLSGGDDGVAAGYLVEQTGQVERLDHLEREVRGVAVQSAGHGHGVADGDALFAQKRFDGLAAEALVGRVDKVVLVVEEDKAEDAPHVVGIVGVEKLHRPAFAGWRETAQQQDAGLWRQER